MTNNRILVTGATGFVGRWTLRHWRKNHPEMEIWATSNQPLCSQELADEFSQINLCDSYAVREFVLDCKPVSVIHLAGLVAEASLADHFTVNVLGTENLYNALSELDNSRDIRIVQAGTAAIYGQIALDELPISENNPLRPLTAYALSKMVQDYLAEMIWHTRELAVIRARIFNLFGPGQPEHLVPATFIRQLKVFRAGDTLQVGNLSARRDFVDVRDVVLAFDKLLAKGQPGVAYNVASGKSIAIQDIINELLIIPELQNISIKQKIARMRKNDVSDIFADISAITEATGWQPKISLHKSLMAMWEEDLSDCANGNTG